MQQEATTPLYVAGVIDSDGYITINRSCRKGRLYHAAQVGIAGTSPEPHQLAASLWGGNVGCYFPKNPAYRPQYQWSRQGSSAVEVIGAVYPYLRVKVENALLALQLQEHVADGSSEDPYPWFGPDYDPIAEREQMRAEMITVLATRKKAAGRLLDGREWSEFPA